MFSKILVANRGEIAVRAFRAAYELGSSTVAVYPWEDRRSEHRLKADEAYEIGERGHPVRAYLDPALIVTTAKMAGADAVYPGYGFLSENPDLAEACLDAGITFIGPSAKLLTLTGHKARATAAATSASVPTLGSTRPSTDAQALVELGMQLGLPVFVKAVSGGGGRGMRRVDADDRSSSTDSKRTDDWARLRDAIDACMREAESAFGDSTVFIEKAIDNPRHIEVQVLADNTGKAIHLFERDCSLQRRHQKVIEMAPAPDLDPLVRKRLCDDAVRFVRHIGYVNAGTVEFLVDTKGRHHFIEMNPRIQVEHTVTEEITNIDLVQAQLRIAAGETLDDLGIEQDKIIPQGAALQCRITTEDPSNGFRPDTGQIAAYRSPGGAGIRLDGGTVYTGAVVSAHFDSLLSKLTCRGTDFPTAIRRARRALAEFRIRGVATNIGFLQAVLNDPNFNAGAISTSFIDDHSDLLNANTNADRGTKLLNYLADVTLNKPHGNISTAVAPADKLPGLPEGMTLPSGSRAALKSLGPKAFARNLREQDVVAVTDTTFRDAHQSLLATRMRTRDLVSAAGHVAYMLPELFSIEAWGGATYDVALRFLSENPWERLAAIRESVPNICLQMLLRGRNMVGYTPYPREVTDTFIAEATRTGIDIFRIFDALNNVEQMRPAIESVRSTDSAVAEVALCYTGDLLSPDEKLYTLDYYLDLASQIVDAGAHIIAIKDMAGLLRPPAAAQLVTALRLEFDLPVHLHTHDTAGGQLGTLLAAINAGVDAVDGASAPMAGSTSQPALSSLVAATDHTDRRTELQLPAVTALEPYWEATRRLYAPFESGVTTPTGRIYDHEIPGGQLSNLRQQAIALGLGEKFERIESMYAAASQILGNIVKVTPTSKVVGDLALYLVAVNADPDEFVARPSLYDIPESVISFLSGDLGDPPTGWPEPFRTDVLLTRTRTPQQETELTVEQQKKLAESPQQALNELLFPESDRLFREACETYGDLSRLPTPEFLYGLQPGQEHTVEIEPGKVLLLSVESVGEPDDRGLRTVMCTINGQLRPVVVLDRSIQVEIPRMERANPDIIGEIAAPYAGVVTLTANTGEIVSAGQAIATIEAMKMESSIAAPFDGIVQRLAIDTPQQVESGELIAVITEEH